MAAAGKSFQGRSLRSNATVRRSAGEPVWAASSSDSESAPQLRPLSLHIFYKIVPMGEELLPLLPSRTRKRGLWVAVVIYILAAAVVCVIVTGNIRDSERDSVLAPIQSKTYFAVVQPKVKFIFERARLLYDVSLMIRTDQVLLCTIIFDSHGNKSRK